jgi:hypothetical protein
MRPSKYSGDQKIASRRYSSIKARVNYDLEKFWFRDDFIAWYMEQEKECCYCCNPHNTLHGYPVLIYTF